MKKILTSLFTLLLAATLCVSFVSCNSDGEKKEDTIFSLNAKESITVTKINDREETADFFCVGFAVIRLHQTDVLTLRASDFTVQVAGQTLTGTGFVGEEHITGGTLGRTHEITLTDTKQPSESDSVKLAFRGTVSDTSGEIVLFYHGKEVSRAKES